MTTEVVRGQDWDAVRERLVAGLRLSPQSFVTLDPPEPAGKPQPRRGLMDRLRGREAPRSRPLVQIAHDGTTLDAECSGPATSGRAGTGFPWSPDQKNRLVDLGWGAPDELDDWHMYRWRAQGDVAAARDGAARQAAALAVATLRDVYGMESPDGLTVVVDRFP